MVKLVPGTLYVLLHTLGKKGKGGYFLRDSENHRMIINKKRLINIFYHEELVPNMSYPL